jgi:hypothetical protein
MAIIVKFSVSNSSAEKYEEVLRRLETAGAVAPRGQLFHVTYGSRDNLQVINVYDSPDSFESFGKILVPILRELGITAVPEVHEVYKIQNASDPHPRVP